MISSSSSFNLCGDLPACSLPRMTSPWGSRQSNDAASHMQHGLSPLSSCNRPEAHPKGQQITSSSRLEQEAKTRNKVLHIRTDFKM